jgi:large subunit ribosomal protein L3
MVEGAVPGAKSGWVTVRDAIKKKLPKEAPKPGKFRVSEAAETKSDAKPAQDETAQAKPESAAKKEGE